MLTAQEQQELAMLEQEELAAQNIQRQPMQSGLTPQEQAELQALEQEEMMAQQFQQQQGSGIGGFFEGAAQTALEGIGAAGQFIDKFTGAPTRAALGELVTGQGFGAAGDAYARQFGADPSTAPTGKEIYQASGLPDFNIINDPTAATDEQLRAQGFNVPQEASAGLSASGVAGLGIDMLADPTNFIPVGAVAKGIGRGVGEGFKLGAKGAIKTTDILTGTKAASKAAETTTKTIDNVLNSVKNRFSPKQAPDFSSFVEVAQKNGIDPALLPESVEFGPQSTITTKAKSIAEGPGGDAIQERFIVAQNEVQNALDRKIESLGGGQRLSDAEVGQQMLDTYNKATKNFFDQDFSTNARVVSENPGLKLSDGSESLFKSKLNSIEKYAKGRLKRGIGSQKKEASQLMNDIQTLKNSFAKDGTISYKQASEALSNIGEEAFKKVAPGVERVPVDRKKLQDIYFTLRDSMNQTVADKISPELATELANSNKIISTFINEKSAVNKLFSPGVAPEKIAKQLIDNADTAKINALREVYGLAGDEQAWKAFKGYTADKLIKRGATEGNPLYRTTLNKMQQKKDILGAVFDPQEVQDVAELLKLGDRVGNFVLNTSGTARSLRNRASQFFDEILGGAADQATLETLKDVARGKAVKEIKTASGVVKIAPQEASAVIEEISKRKIPIRDSSSRQILESGRLKSIQDTNKKLEEEKAKRKRAIGG